MLEFIPIRQVPQRLSEGWTIVSQNDGDYAAVMHAPEGWEPVIGGPDSVSLLYRVDGTLKRLDGKKPFKRQGRHVTVCRLPDCDIQHYAGGFCRKHYTRLKRNGHPRVVRPPGIKPSKCDMCSDKVHAKGLCNRHYLRFIRREKTYRCQEAA